MLGNFYCILTDARYRFGKSFLTGAHLSNTFSTDAKVIENSWRKLTVEFVERERDLYIAKSRRQVRALPATFDGIRFLCVRENGSSGRSNLDLSNDIDRLSSSPLPVPLAEAQGGKRARCELDEPRTNGATNQWCMGHHYFC